MGRRGIATRGGRRHVAVLALAVGLCLAAVAVAGVFAVRGLRSDGTPEPLFPSAPAQRPTGATVFQADAQVLFDSNSSLLRPTAQQVLREISEQIRAKHPTGTVRVEGYTDDMGSGDYNLDLSRFRAETVATWLSTDGGISRARLVVVPHGENDPAQPNDSEEHRQANRRVVIAVLA